MEAARKIFRIFRYDSGNVRTSGARYGEFDKQVDHRHHTHTHTHTHLMENNVSTSVLANMATMRNYEVIKGKVTPLQARCGPESG
jgi:redox-regulated HSP33 family molecular chaperone